MDRLKINRKILSDLRAALRHAEGLSSDDDSVCAVELQHKRAVRIFVDTWVSGPLRRAIRSIERKDTR